MGRHMAVNPAVQREIAKRFKEVRRLHLRGVNVVLPDINRLEKLMLDEKNEYVNLMKEASKDEDFIK